MKRLGSFLLAAALLLVLCCPALAADSTKATTVRLGSTEGTVTLTNQNGRTLTLRDNMQLYSGYTVKTDAASYAYINLDDTKAVKLDASTTVEIRKSGKNLEVLVNAGKLFFNVSAPLQEDESLEIRTSTIVTGIRGTSGTIGTNGTDSSTFQLYEGHVTLLAIDPVTGESTEVPMSGGQSALVTRDLAPSTPGTGTPPPVAPHVTLTTLTTQDVPGFAAKAMAEDPVLQQKIADSSPLNVPELVSNADQTLRQEQTAAAEQQKKVADAVAKEENRSTPATLPSPAPTAPPPATPAPPPDSGSDSGSGSSSPLPTDTPVPTSSPIPTGSPAPTDTPTPSPSPTTPTLTGIVTVEQIHQALSTGSAVILDGNTTVVVGDTLTVPTDKTLTVGADGSLTVNGILAMNGTLINMGTLSSSGRLMIGGTVTSSGEWSSSGTWTQNGPLTNSGTISNSGNFDVAGPVINSTEGQVNTTAHIALNSVATWSNLGHITISGSVGCLNSSGSFTMAGGVVERSGSSNPTVEGNGTIVFTGGLFLSAQNTDVIPSARLQGGDAGLFRGVCNGNYVLALSLPSLVTEVGDTPSTIAIGSAISIPGQLAVADGQDITLDFRTGGALSLTQPIENSGGLTVTTTATSGSQIVATGCSAIHNSGSLVVRAALFSSGPTEGTVQNAGACSVQANGSITGENRAILNSAAGTLTIQGGAVSSSFCAIENQGTSAGVSIEGGTVELTASVPSALTVKGPFTYTGMGTIRAKASDQLCDQPLADFEPSPLTDGWYMLIHRTLASIL